MCKKADGIVDDAFHALNEAKNAEQINAELVKSYKKELELSKQRIESLEKQLEQKTMKESQLNTVIQDYKNYEKIVNGTILALREKVDEI
jgi:molecular chaperone GrpE (heat shock protein)